MTGSNTRTTSGDGWPDVLTTSHRMAAARNGAILYVNPIGESRRWDKFTVVPPIESEETVMADVDGDGKPELVIWPKATCAMRSPIRQPHRQMDRSHDLGAGAPGPRTALALGISTVTAVLTSWAPTVGGSNLRRTQQLSWKYHPEAFGQWGRTSAGGRRSASTM